jgi:hypothetical protein
MLKNRDRNRQEDQPGVVDADAKQRWSAEELQVGGELY